MDTTKARKKSNSSVNSESSLSQSLLMKKKTTK